MASKILPMGQSFLQAPSSLTRTTSPVHRFLFGFSHLVLACMLWRYSHLHRIQNWSARYWTRLKQRRAYTSGGTKLPGGGPIGRVFIVRSIEGDSDWGSSGSAGMADIGQALTIAVTSAISVTSSSCVSC